MSIASTNAAITKTVTALGIRQFSRRTRARVLAVALQKGGVGKTTFTLVMAAIAALCGLRVLVIDMDPQGNSTETIAADDWDAEEDAGLAAALDPTAKDISLLDAIVPTVWENVWIAPAVQPDMVQAEKLILAMDHGREHRLRDEIEALRGDFDLIIIDCPPALGMLTINALTAADEVGIVAEADQWSKQGLEALAETIDGVKRYANKALRTAWILLNKWNGGESGRISERRILADVQEILAEVETFAGVEVWGRKVPNLESIRTTVQAAKPLTESTDTKVRVLVETTFVPLLDNIMTDKDAA